MPTRSTPRLIIVSMVLSAINCFCNLPAEADITKENTRVVVIKA